MRPASMCDTAPLQRFESHSSSGEEPSSPTAASLLAAVSQTTVSTTVTSSGGSSNGSSSAARHNNNNNSIKLDLQLPRFIGSGVEGDGEAGAEMGAGACSLGNRRSCNNNATKKTCRRIIWDLCALGCVGLPILGLYLFAEPYKRGFFCDDASLKHPYKKSTIRSWMLYLMCLALPISMMLIIEFYRAQAQDKKPLHGNKSELKATATAYSLCHLELPKWIVECYRKVGVFILGLGLEHLTTNIAKYSIGRLRPHFYTLCQPTYENGSCADAIDSQLYIEDFTCTSLNMNAKMFKEMRLSFPSGHASFACYSMLYLVIYMQRRMTWERCKMFRSLLQFGLLMFAWYCSLTRVSDYKHHWSDVLAGSAIGGTYALLVISAKW